MARIGGKMTLDDFQKSLAQFDQALRNEVKDELLETGGEIIKFHLQKSIKDKGLVDTGELFDSITVSKKMSRANGDYVLIYPQGTRRTYRRKEVTKVYKNSKSGRTYKLGGDVKPTTNNDVGFVLEYGSSSIKETRWMSEGAENAVDDVQSAALGIIDRMIYEYL